MYAYLSLTPTPTGSAPVSSVVLENFGINTDITLTQLAVFPSHNVTVRRRLADAHSDCEYLV